MATTKKRMTTRDLVLTGILLAARTVIKAMFPKLPVTPTSSSRCTASRCSSYGPVSPRR
jgi:hypothetical protein